MTMELGKSAPHPSREELLADFGDELFSIQSLFQFCYVPPGRIGHLEERAAEEEWGANHFVLFKYLAVHVRLAIEQGRIVWNGDQIVLCAGRLATTDGTPLYLGLVRNSSPEENPWVMNWVGERPSSPELPAPPDLGPWPELDPCAEVVVACDLASEERRIHLPGLETAPSAARFAAVAGAVSWSLRRGLAVRQIHGTGRGYFVPVHLTGREDLTASPDLVAPVQVQGDRLVVRTVLDPEVAYAPARCVVERWEQLPAWLLDAWDSVTAEGSGGSQPAPRENAD
ncbi:MAG TPA: hypothetical protein ENJ09_09965 [Planctomycetes bacterium]|nr:hypothetical protein [Planctomycetota bacterium]